MHRWRYRILPLLAKDGMSFEVIVASDTEANARRQLEAMVGRVRGDPDRLEMVHNATALLQETAPRRATRCREPRIVRDATQKCRGAAFRCRIGP